VNWIWWAIDFGVIALAISCVACMFIENRALNEEVSRLQIQLRTQEAVRILIQMPVETSERNWH
jgi:hypothetical protein